MIRFFCLKVLVILILLNKLTFIINVYIICLDENVICFVVCKSLGYIYFNIVD